MKKRIVFYLLSIILMVAIMSGCHKRLRVVNTPPVPQPSGYDKFAHIIIDVCDPECSEILKPENGLSKDALFFCSVGMQELRKHFDAIQDDKLKKLIMKYKKDRVDKTDREVK